MHIVVYGINYRSASVDIREPFSVASDYLEEALTSLKAMTALQEVVLVSTCNRTEVYAVCDNPDLAEQQVDAFFAELSNLAPHQFRAHLYKYLGDQAVAHLLRVVTGLDSMVIGETQILGQVRSAFLFAQSMGATGFLFNQLFRAAISFAKRVQTETAIGQSAVSVSYAAALLAKKVFTTLTDKTALILGAGKMAELTLTHLRGQGIAEVLVSNRTYERAADLAKRYGGKALEWSELPAAVGQADIVISSTGARGYVITPQMLLPTLRKRRRRPLFFVDIAVPRDIDPALAKLDEVYVYDIDDLQNVVSAGVALRSQEAERVHVMVAEEVAAFAHWQTQQDVVPLIAELRTRAVGIQRTVLESLTNKLPDLDEREWKVVQKHMASVVNQLLRVPIANLKESSGEPGGADLTDAFARIFGLTQSQPAPPRSKSYIADNNSSLTTSLPIEETSSDEAWEHLHNVDRGSRARLFSSACPQT